MIRAAPFVLALAFAATPPNPAREEEGLVTLTGHAGRVLSIAVSPQRRLLPAGDLTFLASAGEDGMVRLWEVTWVNRETKAREVRSLAGHTGAVTSVSFAPDGIVLASGGSDGTVRLWDAITGQERGTLRAHAGEVTSVLCAPDGNTVVSAGADGTVRLWTVSLSKDELVLQAHQGAVRDLALSEDGKLLASAGDDGLVKLWDLTRDKRNVRTGRLLRTLKGHQGAVRSVAIQSDAKTLVSGGADGTVRVWMTATGEEARTLRGHTAVESVAFSGNHIASGGAEGTVKLWSIYNGLELWTLRSPSSRPVRALAYYWRGNGLAFGDDAGGLRLWDVGLRRTTRHPDGRVTTMESLLRAQKAVFLLDTTAGQLQRIGQGWRPVWSGDGRFLVFNVEIPDGYHGYAIWDGTSVRAFGAATGSPLIMALGPSLLIVELLGAVSDSGEMTASSEQAPPRIVIHDLFSGQRKTAFLTAERRHREQWAVHTGPFAVSPNNDAIALVFQAGRGNWYIHPDVLRSEIVLIRPDGAILRRLGSGAPVRFLSTGELLVEDQSGFPVLLDAVSPESGARRRLFDVPSRFFDVSADGRRLVYMDYEEGGGKAVYAWDAGASPRRLAEGEFPAFSPDGSRVAFGRRSRGDYHGGGRPWEAAIYVMRVADGSLRRYEISGPGAAPPQASDAGAWWSWAPDGRRIALTLEEPPDREEAPQGRR